MAEQADYKEIITEYKDQIRILKDEVDEMQSKLKEKDGALKRTSQKYEYAVEDLDKANSEIKKIIGHYQVDSRKECPSFKVPDWLEQNNLGEYIQV